MAKYTYHDTAERLTLGPGGNVWFITTLSQKVGRISPDGTIKDFQTTEFQRGIASGSDGNLWTCTAFGLTRLSAAGVLTNVRAVPCTGPMTADPAGVVSFSSMRQSVIYRYALPTS